MRFFIWRKGAANIAVYACKPHLFQINALAGPPDRRGEIFAPLVYRQRMTGNHNVGAHFRVVKFIVALEKPHEAEGNAKCPNGIAEHSYDESPRYHRVGTTTILAST